MQGAFEHRHTCMGGEAKAQRLSHAHVGCADDEPHGHAREARDRRKRCGEIRDPRSFCVSLLALPRIFSPVGETRFYAGARSRAATFSRFSPLLSASQRNPSGGVKRSVLVRVPLTPLLGS